MGTGSPVLINSAVPTPCLQERKPTRARNSPADFSLAYVYRMAVHCSVIRTVRHGGLKRLHERGDRRRLRPDLVGRISLVLADLDIARKPSDLGLPQYRIHPLKGELKDYWSITASRNWRIIFCFRGGDVYDVDLVDYH